MSKNTRDIYKRLADLEQKITTVDGSKMVIIEYEYDGIRHEKKMTLEGFEIFSKDIEKVYGIPKDQT